MSFKVQVTNVMADKPRVNEIVFDSEFEAIIWAHDWWIREQRAMAEKETNECDALDAEPRPS